MGKKAKEHRKKVEARNQRIKSQKRLVENAQRKFILDLIEREKNAGAFVDNPTFPVQNSTDQSIITEGPQI